MADESQLIVRLLAEVSQLRAGMDAAQRTVQANVGGIREQLARLQATQRDVITQWNQGWQLAERVLQTFGAAWDATMGGVVRRGEDFQQLGRRLGENVGELSRISFAAQQAGVDLGDVGLAYRSLSRALVEAKDTSSQAHRVLVDGLKLTSDELDRLRRASPTDAILEIGRLLEQHADGAEKAAAGQTLFGRAYQTTMILLREGEEEIRKNIEIAKLYGLTLDQDVADASDRLGDAFTRLNAARDGFFQRLLGNTQLLDTLAGVVEGTADELAAMGRAIPESQTAALREAIAGLATSLRGLVPDVTAAVSALRPLLDGLKWLIDNREAVQGGLAGAAAGGLAGGPVGAIIGGLGGARAGGIIGTRRQNEDAALETIRQQQEEAAARARQSAGITGGLGMTMPGGGAIPSLDLGSPSVLPRPVRPPLAVPTGDEEEEKARARREAYEALLREQERAVASEQDSAARRLEIVRDFSERIKRQFGEESEEFDKQKLVVIRAEQAVGQERYQTLLRDQERDLIAVRGDAAAKLQVVQEYTARVKAEFGEQSDEYQRQLTVQMQAEQSADDQREALAVQRIQDARDAALRELDARKQATEDAARLGQISQRAALEQLRAYWQERLQIQLTAINQERELLFGTTTPGQPGQPGQPGEGGQPFRGSGTEEDRQRLDAQEGQARGEASMGEATTQAEELLQVQQQFEQVFMSISQGWDRTMLGLIQGTQTWQMAVRNMGLNMVAQLSSTFVQIAAKWAAMQLAQLIAQRTADAAKVASTAQRVQAEKAIELPAALKKIVMQAAQAAAGAANAVASIPYVGPILAPIAAATTFAVVMGFGALISAEGGADEIGPEGALARLHPKEMVLPAHLAQGVRRMASMDGGGNIVEAFREAGGTEAQPVSHTTINVSAIDARGVRDFFDQHKHLMADTMKGVARLRNR